LRKLGAESREANAKVMRAVDVPDHAEAPAKATALEALRVMVGVQYDELLRHDPIVRVSDDADAVHEMRVAVRRLRSVLRTARPMLDKGWVALLRDELDWLAAGLGAVRDLDVLLRKLRADAENLDGTPARTDDLLRSLDFERATAREALLECMSQARYYRLLDTVEAAAAAPPTRRDDIKVGRLVRKDFRRLRKRGRRLESQSDAELHKTRIRGKRARYAAELAERSRGKMARRRFIDAATDLQDILGEHQDAVVATERLHELARRAKKTEAAVLAGRLIERQAQHKQDARRRLPAAWRAVERRGKRAWLS
jgi:CHAD domain-containing protein